jgi:hypothetical protein
VTDELTPDEQAISEFAEALVDVLEERGIFTKPEESLGRVLNAGDVAKLLGRSRQWVYEHASELGHSASRPGRAGGSGSTATRSSAGSATDATSAPFRRRSPRAGADARAKAPRPPAYR